jgi:hypothetical protein
MAALGIENPSPKARELVRAYFRALSGSDELVRSLAAPAPEAADLTSRELAEAATQQALAQRYVNLTPEQWRSRTRDMVTNICSNYMVNTAGWVTLLELSDVTKFKPGAIKKALKTLAAAGLLELSGDKARCPLAGRVVKLPPVTPATAALVAKLKGHWETWLADAKVVSFKAFTVRMTKAHLNIYAQHIKKAVSLAALYDNAAENKDESAIYHISAKILQALPKD